MEVPFSRRRTESASRNPPIDPRHEPRQPVLGRSPDPRRTAQTRHRCGSDLGREIYGKTPETSLARMEDVLAQPGRWNRRNGSLCRSDAFVSAALWLVDFKAWPTPDPVAGRDGSSDGRMDSPATHRVLAAQPRARFVRIDSFGPRRIILHDDYGHSGSRRRVSG